MCLFCCTTCEKRIKEYGSFVDCEEFGLDYPMVENTIKLYDKSSLCKAYIFKGKITENAIKKCKSKKVFSYRYDALRSAATLYEKRSMLLKPYKCNICGKWHLTSHRGVFEYNPTEEYLKAVESNKLYD